MAVDIVPVKLDLARRVGATHVVDAREHDLVESARDPTRGGAPYVFESVGSEQVLNQAYHAKRRGGMTVPVGLPHPSRQLSVAVVSVVAEKRTIAGSYMDSAVPRLDIPRLIAMHMAGLLPVDLLLSRVITMDQISAAFDALVPRPVVRQIVRLSDGQRRACRRDEEARGCLSWIRMLTES